MASSNSGILAVLDNTRRRASGLRHIPLEIWMLAPTVIILLVIDVYPTLYMAVMSTVQFSINPDIPSTFVGLQNWLEMFADVAVWKSWLTTILYFVSALGLQLVLGTLFALLIERTPFLSDYLATILLSPMFLAPVLVGLLWRFLLHDSFGVYAYFLHVTGLLGQTSLLGDVNTAFPTVILMDTWEWTPLIMIIVLSGLRSLPSEVLEAALVDGASFIQQLRYITLPLLRPVFVVALLIRSMDLLRFIDHLMVTTAGGPADATKILAIRIYENAFRFYKLGYASVLAITLLAATIVLGRVFVNLLGVEKEEVDA
ncbi:MAG: sugar ABC transporter permease [Chloroflexi bacterium]|nr:sugar ABC transporter permease [Chloroflexota bacterium]